jgi:hypothetical protein
LKVLHLEKMQAELIDSGRFRMRKRKFNSDTASTCESTPDLKKQFQELWEDNAESLIPGLLKFEFEFRNSASVTVKEVNDELRDAFGIPLIREARVVQTTIDVDVPSAVLPVADLVLKRRRQRAVTKEIVRSFQAVDSYHYVECLATDLANGDGYRFKFVCADSFDNKDRAANKLRKAEGKGELAEDISSKHANHLAIKGMYM